MTDYSSWTPRAETLAIINSANGVLAAATEAGYRFTLRRVFYALVSTNVIPNTERAYKNLSATLDKARWEGLMDVSGLDDLGRVSLMPSSWSTPGTAVEAVADQYRSDWWADADTLVEVWVEKAAVQGIVEPVAREYGVRFLACRGFSSLTALAEAAGRWRGRDVRLIYAGDHDPSGLDMDRDLSERLERLAEEVLGVDCSIDFTRVALTPEQIDQYQLPPQPTKKADSRARGYSEDHSGSWEVDALDAGTLAGLVRDAIEEDLPDDFQERQEADEEAKDSIRTAAAAL